MNTEAIKNAVAAAAAQLGVQDYEITIQTEETAGAEALKDEISSVTYSKSSTMQVRCVVAGKSGYAVSELVTPEAAAGLVETACANAGIVDDVDEVPLFAGSEHYEAVTETVPALPSTDEMKAHSLDLQARAYAASDKIVDGTQCWTSGSNTAKALMNSAGLDLYYEAGLVIQGVAAAVKEGDDAANDYAVADITKESAQETVDKSVNSALAMLGAQTVDSGKYNVILDCPTTASMLAVFSTAFSARSAYMKTTLLAGKEGEVIASPNVTIVDDPFYPGKYGHCPFDGEGVAVYTKNLVENGVLNTLMYNRMYGKLLGKDTTGNAADAKTISPKGLYVAPGAYDAQELLEKLGEGLYITGLNGLHAGANTQSGDFSLQAEGFLVSGGKKVRPVKNFTIADNFFSLLKKVDAIGSQVKFRPGSSVGAPEVLFTDISVSGK